MFLTYAIVEFLLTDFWKKNRISVLIFSENMFKYHKLSEAWEAHASKTSLVEFLYFDDLIFIAIKVKSIY